MRQKIASTPKMLRELLGDVLPHIRFPLMSQQDIILRVRFYPEEDIVCL